MASASQSADVVPEPTPRIHLARQQDMDRRFYFAMAIASSLLVLLAFSRTFYLRPYFATRPLDSIVVLHGCVFTAWMLLFIVQTALIATDRPEAHRILGYAGAVFAVGMTFLGLAVAFRAERLGHHAGAPDAETTFLFSLGDILTFALFVALGFVLRRNRETHQRLMLLSVVAGLLSAAPPRLPLVGGHPAGMATVGFAFLFAGPVYDLISRHRIHPAYIWGCVFALLTGPQLRLAIAATPTWHRAAKWLTTRRTLLRYVDVQNRNPSVAPDYVQTGLPQKWVLVSTRPVAPLSLRGVP